MKTIVTVKNKQEVFENVSFNETRGQFFIVSVENSATIFPIHELVKVEIQDISNVDMYQDDDDDNFFNGGAPTIVQ